MEEENKMIRSKIEKTKISLENAKKEYEKQK